MSVFLLHARQSVYRLVRHRPESNRGRMRSVQGQRGMGYFSLDFPREKQSARQPMRSCCRPFAGRCGNRPRKWRLLSKPRGNAQILASRYSLPGGALYSKAFGRLHVGRRHSSPMDERGAGRSRPAFADSFGVRAKLRRRVRRDEYRQCRWVFQSSSLASCYRMERRHNSRT